MGSSITTGRVDRKATERTRRRYSRTARFYDLFEAPMERLGTEEFRRRLFARAGPGRILEIGVGTGKNLPFYPEGAHVTAIDISRAMLARARARRAGLAAARGYRIDFAEMDAQALALPDGVFDFVLGTFVFCSVPDPVLGLAEARRVVKPGGRLLLLEHVRPGNPVLARVFDALSPVVKRMMGPEINRRTVENVGRAGWTITAEENLVWDVVKLITARR